MSRLTISLYDAMHQALKEASAIQGRSIAKIIEEGLILRGIKPVSSASDLVVKSKAHSSLSEDQAAQLAFEEVRAQRNN